MLRGAGWNSAQALEYGLVNRVCKDQKLEEKATAWAATLASGPTQTFGKYKALRNARLSHRLASHLEMEGDAFVDITETRDFREGASAFFERREAQFLG